MSIADPIASLDVDFVEELRLRRWARENYCYADARQASWHPVIHDEMRRRDAEMPFDNVASVLEDDELVGEPTDSTILTDEPLEGPSPVGTTTVAGGISSLGPIVPLAPGALEWHGPHEISPPHARIAATIEQNEMHYT